MSYQLIVKPSAEKELERLPPAIRKRIVEKLAQIEDNPRLTGSVKLAGSRAAHRVRMGEYRIVYEVEDARKTIFVTIIAHRREVYRGL